MLFSNDLCRIATWRVVLPDFQYSLHQDLSLVHQVSRFRSWDKMLRLVPVLWWATRELSDQRCTFRACPVPRYLSTSPPRISRSIITVSVKKVAAKNRSCERALSYLPCSYSFFEMLWKKLPRPHQNISQSCQYLQSTTGYSWRPKSWSPSAWLSFSTANNVCCWFSTRDTKLFAKHFWISLLDDIIKK